MGKRGSTDDPGRTSATWTFLREMRARCRNAPKWRIWQALEAEQAGAGAKPRMPATGEINPIPQPHTPSVFFYKGKGKTSRNHPSACMGTVFRQKINRFYWKKVLRFEIKT